MHFSQASNFTLWGVNPSFPCPTENVKAAIPSAYYDRSQTTAEYGIFQLFG